jgi:hypothetical protein
MASQTSLRFTGGRELEQALLELGTKSAQRVGRFAVRSAARPIADKAKAIVRKKERRLARAIKIRVDRLKSNKSEFSALVYISDRGFDYRPRKTNKQSRLHGRLVARRYDYQVGSLPSVYGGFLERGRNGRWGGPVVPAYPFMRPAWDSEGGSIAMRRIAEQLRIGLEREAARLNRGQR